MSVKRIVRVPTRCLRQRGESLPGSRGLTFVREHSTLLSVGLLFVLALLLSSKGITDTDNLSLNGDMSRHLMNGAFFRDVLADGGSYEPRQYVSHYFAQYPALSLGHHPLLLPAGEGAVMTLLGVSVASGRAAVIGFLLVGIIGWFFAVKSIADETTALLSALVLLTSGDIVTSSRIIMTELPALCMLIVAAYFFLRFSASQRSRDLGLFVLAFVASCYAKQTAIFALPVFVIHLWIYRGFGALVSRRIVLAFGVAGILMLPLLAMTLRFSPTNVSFVTTHREDSFDVFASNLWFALSASWRSQFAAPIAALGAIGLVSSLFERSQGKILFVLWLTLAYAMAVFIGLQYSRHALNAAPAIAFFAAVSTTAFSSRSVRSVLFAVLYLSIGYQLTTAFAAPLERAGGYREAARFVTDNPKGSTILFNSVVDTGYFVFFVRENDPHRKHVVLRADKLLATSYYRRIVEDKISDRAEIYDALDAYGTCYVVLEDVESQSQALNWLRAEARSDPFVLRKKIPIRSKDKRVRDADILIYEYEDCRPADPEAVLDMDLPLVNDAFTVKLTDILDEQR